MNDTNNLYFSSFILSYVSLSVIAGLFTFRLLNSFLDNIMLPILDLTILPDIKFHKLTKSYNNRKTEIKSNINNSEYVYVIRPGMFLKELIIWCFMMLLLYYLYRLTRF